MNRLNFNWSDGIYKHKLKEQILMNDISHLYGGTQWLSTLNKKLHVVHLVFYFLLFVNIFISHATLCCQSYVT